MKLFFSSRNLYRLMLIGVAIHFGILVLLTGLGPMLQSKHLGD